MFWARLGNHPQIVYLAYHMLIKGEFFGNFVENLGKGTAPDPVWAEAMCPKSPNKFRIGCEIIYV